MTKKSMIVALTVMTMLVISACDLVMGTPTGGTTPVPTTALQTPLDQGAVETAVAGTQIALAVEQTLAAYVSPTPEIPPTVTNTLTPSETPQPTFTLTPVYPMVTVSAETNCRTGPGRTFDLVANLQAGESTEVVMRTTVANYWLVRNPDNPTQFCWLWGQYATVTGDWASLPAATPPPTPTPPPGFSVTYLGKMLCGDYVFRFELKNVSDVTWESVRIIITDTNTSTNVTYTSDKFKDYNVCVLTNTLLDLEPDEVGVVVNEAPADFSYNPTGHIMKAVFTLFANNGLSGESESTEITFTP